MFRKCIEKNKILILSDAKPDQSVRSFEDQISVASRIGHEGTNIILALRQQP
jgi:hypothetical protein